MKAAVLAVLVLSLAVWAQSPSPVKHQPISTAWDVPAVRYERTPSHPCNVPTRSVDGVTYGVCVTAPEVHWMCADGARILLESADGVKHCILFPPQETETVTVGAKAKPRR